MKKNEIAVHLKSIRESRGISVRSLAELLNCSFSRVSKIENGAIEPSQEYVSIFSRVFKLSKEERELLDNILRVYGSEYLPEFRSVNAEEAQQEMINRLDANALQRDTVAISFIANSLQVSNYTASLYDLEGIHRDAKERKGILKKWDERREQCLASRKTKYRFVIFESAMLNRVATKKTMIEQVEFLYHVLCLENPFVELRIISQDSRLTYYPSCSFDLYDSRIVSVGLYGGMTTMSHPNDVRRYQEAFDLMREGALDGNESRKLLKRVISRIKKWRD